MSKLKYHREQQNLTQEELAAKSGVSVRTIQRIEAGTEPKGFTLKVLAAALQLDTTQLQQSKIPEPVAVNLTLLKVINLSSLPVTLFPPLNIALPLLIMFIKKEFHPAAKQLVSVQILWTIGSFIVFMLAAFSKRWFDLGGPFMIVVMILLVMANIAIILFNAASIDKKGQPALRPRFNLV
jgi:transcriptional regulator with XRE-family HTH domain